MEEGEIIERYFATILKGDKYHREGEVIEISESNIEEVQTNGLRLLVVSHHDGFDDYAIWHTYPVSIQMRKYRLDLISISLLEGGDRSNRPGWEDEILSDRFDYEGSKDWTDRWP
jgi:hypothetical protein